MNLDENQCLVILRALTAPLVCALHMSAGSLDARCTVRFAIASLSANLVIQNNVLMVAYRLGVLVAATSCSCALWWGESLRGRSSVLNQKMSNRMMARQSFQSGPVRQ
jgi:hypothetical protein